MVGDAVKILKYVTLVLDTAAGATAPPAFEDQEVALPEGLIRLQEAALGSGSWDTVLLHLQRTIPQQHATDPLLDDLKHRINDASGDMLGSTEDYDLAFSPHREGPYTRHAPASAPLEACLQPFVRIVMTVAAEIENSKLLGRHCNTHDECTDIYPALTGDSDSLLVSSSGSSRADIPQDDLDASSLCPPFFWETQQPPHPDTDTTPPPSSWSTAATPTPLAHCFGADNPDASSWPEPSAPRLQGSTSPPALWGHGSSDAAAAPQQQGAAMDAAWPALQRMPPAACGYTSSRPVPVASDFFLGSWLGDAAFERPAEWAAAAAEPGDDDEEEGPANESLPSPPPGGCSSGGVQQPQWQGGAGDAAAVPEGVWLGGLREVSQYPLRQQQHRGADAEGCSSPVSHWGGEPQRRERRRGRRGRRNRGSGKGQAQGGGGGSAGVRNGGGVRGGGEGVVADPLTAQAKVILNDFLGAV